MTEAIITDIRGREILDSRGNPTVEVQITLKNGVTAIAGVPSGASTGSFEAIELRDGDVKRYGGKGVLRAVANVNGELRARVVGMNAIDQEAVDKAMCVLDNTDNKARLGANAILGISLATARAASIAKNVPLYQHIHDIFGDTVALGEIFPVPMFNIINGGEHSDSGLSVQEFKFVPKGIEKYAEQLRAGSEVFHSLRSSIAKLGLSVGVGDEGGFAPHMESHAQAFETIASAAEQAGYPLGDKTSLGIDAAANSFFSEAENLYILKPENVRLNRDQMISMYREWIEKYSLISIEDGLCESDWEGWAVAEEKLSIGDQGIMMIGDDLLVTNPSRLAMAIEKKACNAVLIKPNQIGTLSETLETMRLAKKHNFKTVMSHRSGETTDDFIADLAVGASANFIKTGSLSRGERLAKYNRLLAIASVLEK